MQRLHYTGSSIIITDDLAEAVLAYASALADTQSSDVVLLPVVEESGDLSHADLLLGPASQLYTTPAPHVMDVGNPDTVDAVISDLRLRTARLRPAHPMPESGAPFDLPGYDIV